ncbi:phage portal protein [Cellulomonas soli]|uniref:phage portal protein n=1 Tax=Cellulomonas soli TaxID=931535 RepID=UPI003F83928E
MKALDALAGLMARSAEDPSQPIGGERLLSQIESPHELWGNHGGGGNPMQVGAAYRCIQILASTTAGIPLKVRNRETRNDVHIPALAMERVGTTPFEMWETVVSHIATRGNAYVRKVHARDGRLVELMPIAPTRVEVEILDGDDAAAVGMPFVKRFKIDGGALSLTERDIMHIPWLSLDGVKGVSPVTLLRKTFERAHRAEDLASRLYDHGLFLSGFLATEDSLTDEQAMILRRRWNARFSGLDHAGDVGVLDNGAKFQQVSMSPADAQFLETRKFNTTDIARIYGLPGWMINDQEKSTSWGTGMEQQFIAFVVLSLQPYFQRIEQRVTREICDPRTESAKFKAEGLLRGDSKARAAFYQAGITGGWMVPNEPRDFEDMPPVPWGDKPYRPFNASAGAQASDDTTTGGNDDDDADA